MTPQTDKKLFLFDAFALIYRAYFAFAKNPRINSKGQDTSAILGLVNTLMDVQMKEQPSHWAICFDTSEPTERHICLLYTSPSPRDGLLSRMPSSA